MSDAESPLIIEGLNKSFGDVPALRQLNLTMEPGEILALLGPSGCGKTTLLRCIAGLLDGDDGVITMGGRQVFGAGQSLPPNKRDLGMVFQDYALWPHMSLEKNVAFPLRMRGVPAVERRRRVREALALVDLDHLADRRPGSLSGGQQQRVALARAIVARPRLLLMDEPLSNLDKGLREQLAVDIRRLVNELGLSAVFVTHDQQEAYAMADRVAVLHGGWLQQVASPRELFEAPATPELAGFLDIGTLLEGELGPTGFQPRGTALALPFMADDDHQGPASVLVPRRALSLNGGEAGGVPGRVVASLFQGERHLVRVALDEGLTLALTASTAPAAGDRQHLSVDPALLRGWSGSDRRPLRFRPLSAVPLERVGEC